MQIILQASVRTELQSWNRQQIPLDTGLLFFSFLLKFLPTYVIFITTKYNNAFPPSACWHLEFNFQIKKESDQWLGENTPCWIHEQKWRLLTGSAINEE